MKNNIFLENFTKIYFIGIGGISLSALAKLMQKRGKIVTGSDVKKTNITKELESLGIKVFIKHNKKNITSDIDLVVFSSAIKQNNEELVKAKKLNIICMERFEFLGLLSKTYEEVIAVSGSHGKTTTCGMLASIFKQANLNPTVHIGGESNTTNGNMLIGANKFFITEACEYKNSFLKLNPQVGLILNIENDHTDYFKNVNAIILSFQQFAKNSKMVVVEEKYSSMIEKEAITYGFSKGDYIAKNIKNENGKYTSFQVEKKGKEWGTFKIKSLLKHNVYNALASIIVADYYGISKKNIQEGLFLFEGIKRRFEMVEELNKSIIIHDYAHHPTEIASTIKACSDIYKKPITVIFQPHTYTRTKALMKDFLNCFSLASTIIIAPTYKAREKKVKGGRAVDLYHNLHFLKPNCYYLKTFQKIKKHLIKHQKPNEIILILGAGDIENLAYDYLK